VTGHRSPAISGPGADSSKDGASERPDVDWVVLGSISAVFGTRGWVKAMSETRPRDAIFEYPVWYVGSGRAYRQLALLECRVQGPSLLARLQGIDSREAAEALVGSRIAVPAAELVPLPPDQFYWRDLIGMRVVNEAGQELGVLQAFLETGGADVMRVRGERERLIPFVTGTYVLAVDQTARLITVDWHPDD
jgi:16S rRNA processing protein RimM